MSVDTILAAGALLVALLFGLTALLWPHRFDSTADPHEAEGLRRYFPRWMVEGHLRAPTKRYRLMVRMSGALTVAGVIAVLITLAIRAQA